MPFSFLNPLLLAGVLGAAVPVLVHLLGRRQAPRRPFPAIAFLLGSERRLAARRRIRHLLLLVARAALIAAAAVALARPLLVGAIAAGSGQPVSAVVLLDASASMSARGSDGESAFDRARRQVRTELTRLPPGSEVLVITAAGWTAAGSGSGAQRLSPGFVHVSESLRLLERARATFHRASLPALAAEVRASLLGARRVHQIVIVASDLQASSWDGAAGAAKLGAPVLLLDVGSDSDDVAILSASVSGDDERTATLRFGRHPQRPAGDVAIRLESADGLVNRGSVSWTGTTGSAVLAIPEAVPHGAELTAVIDPGGALAANDRSYLWLPSPRRVRVLLADGAPHPSPWADEIFYLERALATEPRLAVHVVDASQAHLPDLGGYDVVILADASRLDAASVRQLSERVEAGLGLLFTAGGKTDPSEMQATLGRLLPVRPRGFHTRRAGEPPLQLTIADRAHPVLRPFDSAASAETLRSARITKLLALEAAPQSHVILGVSDGPPGLVEGRHGAGRVAALAISVDREFSDLAVRPAFVPLMTRLVLHLAGRVDDDRPHAFLVGEAVTVSSPVAGDPPRWDAPDGAEVQASAGVVGSFTVTPSAEPGLYRAYVGELRAPELDFTVNLDPLESDYSRLDAEEALARLGFGGGGEDRLAGGQARESATGILWILVMAFLVEAVLGRREAGNATRETA